MIGDSLTWQMYNSLACLLAPVTAEGFSTLWENANTTVTKEYKGREWPEDRHILKQYWCVSGSPCSLVLSANKGSRQRVG